MTLQNRVDPWGNLLAVSARGAWLGNRGVLHNEKRQIVSPWRHKSWITCELKFKGRQREVFSVRKYSELFFLDEATALASGHRPCAECRRERYNEFKALWCAANIHVNTASPIPIAKIDKQLHLERVMRGGGKVTFQTDYRSIPAGTFIEINDTAFLFWQGQLHEWSPYGYNPSNLQLAPSATVTVLTPASIVRLFSHGFKPQVDESAVSPKA